MSRRNPERSTRAAAAKAKKDQDEVELDEHQGNVFVVEKVINKRQTRSGSEYLIKWQGFPASQSTWEPRENLQCSRMIDEYEKSAAAKRNPKKRRVSPSLSPSPEPSISKNEAWSGKQLKTIIGLTKAPGELTFLCKFADDSMHLIPAREANVRYPNHVIKFYEAKLAVKEPPTIYSDDAPRKHNIL